MSLLHFLQLQPVEDDESSELDTYAQDESITLQELPEDEERLEQFWESVSADIHQDPEWFNFAEGE